MRFLAPVVVLGLSASAAQAQALSYTPFAVAPGQQFTGGPPLTGPVDLSRAYVGVSEYRTPSFADPSAFTGSGFVPVAALLAPAQDTASQSLGSALVGIAARLDRLSDRFSEGIALAGAINVPPPNPGDRFAIAFGGAGYGGVGAGSVAISARIDESTLAYVGYARGPTQSLIKGGIGFSFR